MKSKLFLAVFYVAAAVWGWVVLSATASWEPWAAWGLAMTGAFGVGAIGLRLYCIIVYRNTMRELYAKPVYPVAKNKSFVLDSCQTMYRKPYLG